MTRQGYIKGIDSGLYPSSYFICFRSLHVFCILFYVCGIHRWFENSTDENYNSNEIAIMGNSWTLSSHQYIYIYIYIYRYIYIYIYKSQYANVFRLKTLDEKYPQADPSDIFVFPEGSVKITVGRRILETCPPFDSHKTCVWYNQDGGSMIRVCLQSPALSTRAYYWVLN